MKQFIHSIEVTPAFHEIDIMEVVWHGHYTKYFELAREALMEQYDYGYQGMRDSGYAWPIVDLTIRYCRPAQYAQKLRITATLIEWENRLKINYRIHDADTDELLTKGQTLQVAMDIATRTMCFVSPDVLFEKLGLSKP
jgi:acyl-CoA thioester hydrolase